MITFDIASLKPGVASEDVLQVLDEVAILTKEAVAKAFLDEVMFGEANQLVDYLADSEYEHFLELVNKFKGMVYTVTDERPEAIEG